MKGSEEEDTIVEGGSEEVELVFELDDDELLILDDSTKTGPFLLGDGLLDLVDCSISCFGELENERLDARPRDRPFLHLGRVQSESLERSKEKER